MPVRLWAMVEPMRMWVQAMKRITGVALAVVASWACLAEDGNCEMVAATVAKSLRERADALALEIAPLQRTLAGEIEKTRGPGAKALAVQFIRGQRDVSEKEAELLRDFAVLLDQAGEAQFGNPN